jgi:RNA polymerase sigma-70 factor, ECF subfamily
MPEEGCQDDAIRRAVAGDRAALEGLLAAYYPRLAAQFTPGIPADLRGALGVEDVLQEAFVDVFQAIGDARAKCGQQFYAWLAAIVEHRMVDLIRGARAARRGGGWSPLDAQSASMVCMLEQVAVHSRTPSTSAAGHEVVAAIQGALGSLPEDYREAVRLRYIEELPVVDVAARMSRTEVAVQMLCHRGLRQLAVAMGSASRFV